MTLAKGLAAGLPVARLADRFPPSPEDGNKIKSRHGDEVRVTLPAAAKRGAPGIKARRVETAKRVPFTRARPGALA